MINIMQLKAKIKNISKEKNISAQLVLQNYMMERFIERISLSDFKINDNKRWIIDIFNSRIR